MLTRCCSTLLSCSLATVGEVKFNEAAAAKFRERFCLYDDTEEEIDDDDDDDEEEQ